MIQLDPFLMRLIERWVELQERAVLIAEKQMKALEDEKVERGDPV